MNDKEQIAMLRGVLEYCSENMEDQTNAEIEMFQQALASVPSGKMLIDRELLAQALQKLKEAVE